MSLFRTLLSALLVCIGVASPWLVRDWLDGSSGREPRGAGPVNEAIVSLGRQWRERRAGGREAGAPPEGSRLHERIEPHPLASHSGRVIEGAAMPSELPVRDGGAPGAGALPGRTGADLADQLAERGLETGARVLLRIFKEERELELWMRPEADGDFALFKTYPLLESPGGAGPKLEEGDGRAPEGFYRVGSRGMQRGRRGHLGMDLGFPNELDRQLGRSGGGVFIQSGADAPGSFALAPPCMAEVHALSDASLRGGQDEVTVHVFPFRMTDLRMEEEWGREPEWLEFWTNLKEGYDFFENVRRPPGIEPVEGRYHYRLR